MKTLDNDFDLRNSAIFCVNGIIVAYFDRGLTPSIEDIQANWQYQLIKGRTLVTDNDIQYIINAVSKYYN